MDLHINNEASAEVSVSFDDTNSSDPEAESSKIDLIVHRSSNGEAISELGIAEKFLTRIELDLACASEKLVNLNVFMMYVATKQSDFELIASPKQDSIEALELDLLSGILDSELTELDNFMITSQKSIVEVHNMVSSYKHLGERFVSMEEKLSDSEISLERLQDQISEIREQSVKFQKTLSCLNGEDNWQGYERSPLSEDGQFSGVNVKIKMQTAEQQRHFLRMLEKSLAREMQLENKLTESRHIEEDLKHRLDATEQEMFFVVEEAVDTCERCFAAENVAEILNGISQELLNRVQMLQFNLNGSNHRETELRSKLEKSIEELEIKENALQKLEGGNAKFNNSLLLQIDSLKANLAEAEDKLIHANSEALTLQEKLTSLEKQLEEVGHLRITSEKVDSLEKQLRESDVQLQHAVASAEASQEKQNMLYSTIGDMENLIEDLKLKVLKAEGRADSAEDKCIILSESNAALTEELRFLRGKVACLEASLNRAEETKMATARDIGVQTKVIMDLVMRLGLERERLQKQLQRTGAHFVVSSHLNRGNGEKGLSAEHDKTQISAIPSKSDQTKNNTSAGETEMKSTDFISESGDARRIDVGVLNLKHIFMAVLALLISAVVYLLQAQDQSLRQQ